MGKKKKPKVSCGQGIVFSLPTDNRAGPAKDQPVIGVEIQDAGVLINKVELRLGDSREFRVGGEFIAIVGRKGPAPDSPIWIDAFEANTEPVKIEYHHALTGDQTEYLQPGKRFTLNSVLTLPSALEGKPGMGISAPTWERS